MVAQAPQLAAQVEKTANDMEREGFRLVSFAPMPSAKGVLVFYREGPEEEPSSP